MCRGGNCLHHRTSKQEERHVTVKSCSPESMGSMLGYRHWRFCRDLVAGVVFFEYFPFLLPQLLPRKLLSQKSSS